MFVVSRGNRASLILSARPPSLFEVVIELLLVVAGGGGAD
jgi:hypothetical protein